MLPVTGRTQSVMSGKSSPGTVFVEVGLLSMVRVRRARLDIPEGPAPSAVGGAFGVLAHLFLNAATCGVRDVQLTAWPHALAGPFGVTRATGTRTESG